MQVFLKGQLLSSVNTLEEGELYIEEYQRNIYDRYKYFIDKAEELISEISYKVRERKFGESEEEYSDFISKNYNDLYLEIDKLGKDYFKDDFVETCIYNSKDCLVGYRIKKDNEIKFFGLENMSLQACTKFVYRKDFEII